MAKRISGRYIFWAIFGWAWLLSSQTASAAAVVRFDKAFLAGVIEKLPPCSFQKTGKYRGVIHSYRLVAIDPRNRQFLASCQIEGEFHPPVAGPISERIGRSPDTPEGWRRFRFDVRARVNIEPGVEGVASIPGRNRRGQAARARWLLGRRCTVPGPVLRRAGDADRQWKSLASESAAQRRHHAPGRRVQGIWCLSKHRL